jgi:hypothetical protein
MMAPADYRIGINRRKRVLHLISSMFLLALKLASSASLGWTLQRTTSGTGWCSGASSKSSTYLIVSCPLARSAGCGSALQGRPATLTTRGRRGPFSRTDSSILAIWPSCDLTTGYVARTHQGRHQRAREQVFLGIHRGAVGRTPWRQWRLSILRIHVVIETSTSIDSGRLTAAINQQLAELPRRVHYLTAPPRNQMGKVLRQEVRLKVIDSTLKSRQNSL